MPQIEEMAHRLVGAGRMSSRHRRDALVQRHQRIEDDEAITAVEQPHELRARFLGQDHQRTVRLAVQAVEHRDLAVVLAAGGGEDDLQVELRERLRRAGQDA